MKKVSWMDDKINQSSYLIDFLPKVGSFIQSGSQYVTNFKFSCGFTYKIYLNNGECQISIFESKFKFRLFKVCSWFWKKWMNESILKQVKLRDMFISNCLLRCIPSDVVNFIFHQMMPVGWFRSLSLFSKLNFLSGSINNQSHDANITHLHIAEGFTLIFILQESIYATCVATPYWVQNWVQRSKK